MCVLPRVSQCPWNVFKKRSEIGHFITFFLLFIFIHSKGINIHMTYNNNENKQSEIITLSLYL